MAVRATIAPNGKRIEVSFPFDYGDVQLIKQVTGRKFDGTRKVWLLPLSLEAGRELRAIFGQRLELSPELAAWGRKEIRRERNLGRLATADDAELSVLPADFAQFLDPHQRADVAFLAERDAINGNEPGLGKTEEMIAAVIEAGLVERPVLVTAPVSTLETTWQRLIQRWLPGATILTGDTLAARDKAAQRAQELADRGEPFWLVVNPDFLRLTRDRDAEPIMERGKLVQPAVSRYPGLHSLAWGAVIVDEFRKVGLSNASTLAHRGFSSLKAERRWLLSGTPMGGNPLNLWGALNWIAPQVFTSKWNWAKQWMDSEPNPFATSGLTFLPRIKPGLEDAFYAHLAPYMIRRTRAEVRKNAAPRVDNVWCKPTKKQRKQYDEFAKVAETRVGDSWLEADGVLAEYTRLRQIAVAEIKGTDPVVFNPSESGKINRLIDALAERGITGKDQDGEEKVVVASQWNTVLDAVAAALAGEGIEFLTITGRDKARDRITAQNTFQSDDGPRVMLINTTAGGVGIDLDRADSVHILDETWDPDDQLQVEFRIDRRGRTRTAPMDIFYYRTVDTIDEYINETNLTKKATNEDLLELRRAAFKSNHKES